MSNLLRTANKFLKLSGGDLLVKNNNEALKEISNMFKFDSRIELANENWDELGEGSSRIIFKMSDSLILKLAKNDAGIDQNKSEMSMRAPCLNNVLAGDLEGKWIISRFTETMSEDAFKDAVGISFKTFMAALYFHWNNEKHEGKPNDYDDIKEHPLFKCLSGLVDSKDLQIGDCSKTSSWGMLDGKPLLRDFGLTKDVFIDHYDDPENKTKTISISKT